MTLQHLVAAAFAIAILGDLEFAKSLIGDHQAEKMLKICLKNSRKLAGYPFGAATCLALMFQERHPELVAL